VRPGAFVRSGDELFTLAGQTRRWLHVQVPEKFSSQIHKAQGAWLLYEQSTVVLDGDHNARVAKVAQQVEPRSRTVAIAIEYPSAVGPQLLGARLPAQVYVGEPKLTLSIPASALIDDGGRPVVYVQTGGESFSRRPVNPGIRDGEWVEILSGV